MKNRWCYYFFCLILLSGILAACGGGSGGSGNTGISYTGDFLSWTGSDDTSHYFTLVRVNGQTGSVTTIGGFDFFTGLAYGPDGKLYGVSNKLCIINPANGTTSKVGNLISQGTVTPILMTEAAFAPDGRLFVAENASPRRVFTVDLLTGGLTLVGTQDTATIARGIEFSANGTLYVSFADLYTLNPIDGSTVSKLGSTGGVYISNLALGSDEIMFGKDIFPSTHIYSLSLTTGTAEIVTAVTSTGLISLVAERATQFAAASLQNVDIRMATASFTSVESLLSMENEIKKTQLAVKIRSTDLLGTE